MTVGGIVSAIKQLTTKKGDPMVFLRLDDVVGSAEVVVFNSVYAAARELLVPDAVLVVKARVDHKEGETKLIALEVTAFEATPERREVRLKLDARQARAGIIRELAAVVRDFPGEAPVVVDLVTSEGPRTLQFGTDYRVQAGAGLLRRGEGAPRRGRRGVRPRRVYETVVYATDLEAARAFYRDALGLREVEDGVFRLDDDGVLLLFDPTESSRPGRVVPSHGPAGAIHVAFAVGEGELDAWRERLAEPRRRARAGAGVEARRRALALRPRPGRQLGRAGRGRPLAELGEPVLAQLREARSDFGSSRPMPRITAGVFVN